MKFRIDFHLSSQARNAEFIASGNRPAASCRVEFDMAADATTDQRAALVEKFGGGVDAVELHDYSRERYGKPVALELEAVPTWAEAFPLLISEADAGVAYKAAKEARVAQEAAERDAAEHAAVARQAAERDAAAVVRQLAEQAKAAWVEAHGSDHLKRACAHGYDCQRLYVLERARLELPGYTVDFQDAARWSSRACPSVAALDEVDRVERLDLRPADEIEIAIVWLTAPAQDRRDDEDDYPDEFEPCEAVVARSYLGRYDLVRRM